MKLLSFDKQFVANLESDDEDDDILPLNSIQNPQITNP